MTENDLKKYFSEIHFDKQKKKEILLNVMEKNVHEEEKKHIRLHILVACAAVMSVLLIITTAVVANRAVIHDLLQKYLGVNNGETIQSIEPDSKQYSCCDKDIRVNILQTLSDNKTVYVLYEIVFPNNETAVVQNDPDAVSFTIGGITDGTYTIKPLSISENTVQNIIIYDTSEQITSQNELTLNINKIFTQQYEINGSWIITWNSNSESNNISLNTHITLSSNNASAIINQIYLSPLSLSLGTQTNEIDSITDNALSIVVHTVQGEISVNEILDDKAIYYDKESGTCEIYYRFHQMLKIEEITGITIENQYIDLINIS